jgi:hypothetical protein
MESNNKEDYDQHEDLDDQEDEDSHINNEKLQSRFYRKDFPEENDLVVVSHKP